MGFWSNFSKVFGSKPGDPQGEAGAPAAGRRHAAEHAVAARPVARTGVPVPAGASNPPGWVKEGGTPIHAGTRTPPQPQHTGAGRAPDQPRSGEPRHIARPGMPLPSQPRPIDPNLPRNAQGELVNPPRTKQELFEELHRNYREVLHLVRKVNTHLDREQARGDRMMRLAGQVEAALPRLEALAQMPGAINAHASELHAELLSALRDADQSEDARTKRIESVLGQISETMHEGAEGQLSLNRTMASFRETISDANKDARRSSQAMEELATRSARREEELMKLLADSKRWSAVGLAMCGVVGLVAIGVGILAVLLVTGRI